MRSSLSFAAVVALAFFGCGGQTADTTGQTGTGAGGASGSGTNAGGGTALGGAAGHGTAGSGASPGAGGAAGTSAGGSAQAGTAQGGSAHGGTAQGGTSTGGQQAGGHAGGAAAGCFDGAACTLGPSCTAPTSDPCCFVSCMCTSAGVYSCAEACADGPNCGGPAGAGGASPACCTSDFDCGDAVFSPCVNGVCKDSADPTACWRNDMCPMGESCVGAFVCPCGGMCQEPDTAGKCMPTTTPTWATCQKPGDCQLAANSCCGTCGTPQKTDLDAVDYLATQPHQMDVCPVPQPCPACVQGTNADLAAFCTAGTCQVVEISKDDVSACSTDADCTMHLDQCCDCGTGSIDQYVALDVKSTLAYEAQICGPNNPGGCTLGCVGSHPFGYASMCNPATKHCAIVPVNATDVCPADQPANGSACGLPSGTTCEYGSSYVTGCRAHLTCEAGVWNQQFPPGACPPISPAGQNGCPTSTSVAGQNCTTEGLLCDMGGGTTLCECTSCAFGPCSVTAAWACTSPAPPPCPASPPDVGQPCTVEGTSCMYGVGCDQTSSMRGCQNGVWVDQPFACAG